MILDRLEYYNRSPGYHHHKQIKQCNTKQNNYSNIPTGLSRIILAIYNNPIVLLYRMSSVDLKFIFEKYRYCCYSLRTSDEDHKLFFLMHFHENTPFLYTHSQRHTLSLCISMEAHYSLCTFNETLFSTYFHGNTLFSMYFHGNTLLSMYFHGNTLFSMYFHTLETHFYLLDALSMKHTILYAPPENALFFMHFRANTILFVHFHRKYYF